MPFVHARKTGIVVIALADFGHSPTLTPYESTSEHSYGKLGDNSTQGSPLDEWRDGRDSNSRPPA